jgi:hypothetical protein
LDNNLNWTGSAAAGTSAAAEKAAKNNNATGRFI